MIKIFCDICRKEIKSKNDSCRLTAVKVDSIVYRSDDVCDSCINDINNFIKNHLRTYTLISKKDIDTDSIADGMKYTE